MHDRGYCDPKELLSEKELADYEEQKAKENAEEVSMVNAERRLKDKQRKHQLMEK